ncbi:MAG: hypothetical protein LBV53_01670 [Mycoplasmataceae bacterium]|jgi:hypothetical protein|nr:hypothetical protein [Mycoplasmataceae bacterium]
MKKEKTIKITEFGMKPELVGAIIKYITMIATTVHNSNPIPRKQQQPRSKRLTIEDLAKILNNFILETRANFKRIDVDINNIITKNNLKR